MSISSGEAEFYAIVYGVIMALYFYHMSTWLGYEMEPQKVYSSIRPITPPYLAPSESGC